MPYLCPECGVGKVVYENSNKSICKECFETIPNARLRALEPYPFSQADLTDGRTSC